MLWLLLLWFLEVLCLVGVFEVLEKIEFCSVFLRRVWVSYTQRVMTDLSSILSPAKNSNIDFVNAFVIVLGTVASGLLMMFYGLNAGETGLAILGAVFWLLAITGLVFVNRMGGSLLTSDASLSQSAFLMWAPMFLFNLSGILSALALSAFAAPNDAYAASILAGQPDAVVDFTVGWLAPAGENIAFLGGLGALTVRFTTQRFGVNLPAIAAGLVPSGLIFAGIHSKKLAQPSFLLTAFSIMFIWGLYLYSSDLGVELPLREILVGSFSLFYGVHRGINIASLGGFGEYYGSILGSSATQIPGVVNLLGIPVNGIILITVVLDAITVVMALYYVVNWVLRWVR